MNNITYSITFFHFVHTHTLTLAHSQPQKQQVGIWTTNRQKGLKGQTNTFLTFLLVPLSQQRGNTGMRVFPCTHSSLQTSECLHGLIYRLRTAQDVIGLLQQLWFHADCYALSPEDDSYTRGSNMIRLARHL